MSEFGFINANNELNTIINELSIKTGIPNEQFKRSFPNWQHLDELKNLKICLDVFDKNDLSIIRGSLREKYTVEGLQHFFSQFSINKGQSIDITVLADWVTWMRGVNSNENQPSHTHNEQQTTPQNQTLANLKKMLVKSIKNIGHDIRNVACKGAKEFQEFIEEIKEHPLLSVTSLLATAALVITLKNSPNFKIGDMKTKLADALTNSGFGTKTSYFGKVQLNCDPESIISRLNITKNDDLQLYILSSVIDRNTLDAILQEFGYVDFENYIRIGLGYKDTPENPASYYYYEDMEGELSKLAKNPDYDLLRYLYDEFGVYISEKGDVILLGEPQQEGRNR